MTTQCIYGFHAVKGLLQNGAAAIDKVYLLQERADARGREIANLAAQRGVACLFLTRAALDQLTGFAKHQGFAALVSTSVEQQKQNNNEGAASMENHATSLEELLQQVGDAAFLLVLDGVQDPHNLGACLRTANAAGVHAVIAPRDNAVGLTSAARKVACGAAEATPFFQVTNLARTLRMLKECGVWIYGMALEEEGSGDGEVSVAISRSIQSIYKAKWQPPLALVLGAEEKGLRRLTREQCDFLINIPMAGAVQSLNVSVAAGICLFEVVRNLYAHKTTGVSL